MQIGLLEPRNFSAVARAALTRVGTVIDWDGRDLATFLRPLDALFVRLAHRIDQGMLDLAPRLRWVCSPTTSHLHIDESAMAARGVTVLSLRGERAFLDTVRATPEHTFGLILALLRRYRAAFANTLCGEWDRDSVRGEELYANRVGIVGLGRVGALVARYCAAFGAHVIWFDPADVPADDGWERVHDLAELVARSRIVVLCANFEAGQPPIMGRAEVNGLTGRYLVNTARGELIDEPALLDAIRADRLAGVAVDVLTDEHVGHRLAEWIEAARGRNVIVTPHLGGATVEAMAATELFVAERLAATLQAGGAPR